jgi:cyclohexa-1,5-dienecarbonyl-CoA hydratase
MGYKHIKVVETSGGEVTEITLGPPPANILSAGMMQEIVGRLREDQTKREKKLITFTGEGKHFCFGASVEEHAPEKVGDMLPGFHSLIGEVINCSIPTLAKVSGQCLGGGFELVLACDFIFAAKGAKFGLPEIQLGVFPPPACILVPYKCSGAVASEMVLTGDKLTAEQLQGLGLVNRVAEPEELDGAVSAFFQEQIHPKSASSLRVAKSAVSMMLREWYKSFIGSLEDLYLKDLMDTADAVEGIQAFLEKRSPRWRNE